MARMAENQVLGAVTSVIVVWPDESLCILHAFGERLQVQGAGLGLNSGAFTAL